MNKIDAKELETRLKDLWNKAEKELKSEGGAKLEVNKDTINAYLSKGIRDGKVAWILYNLGVNISQLDDDPDRENGVRNFTYKENSYNLLDEASLRDFVQAKSQDINPLLYGDTAWADTGGVGRGQPLTDKEKTLITDDSLSTAESKHAGAVLLAHLRAIKKAAHTNNNYQLDQKSGNGVIDSDWTATSTNQEVINSQITNPIATKHYQALEKYAAAETDTAKALAWARAKQDDFGEIANKVWNRAQSLNNQIFIDQFKANYTGGNRIDWEQTQLTLENLIEILGPESFNEGYKYIGNGPAGEKEYFLLKKITQERIDKSYEDIKDKWIPAPRNKLNSKVLNDFLGDWKDRTKKEWISLKVGKNDNLYKFLTDEGGYEIDKNPEDGSENFEGKEILKREEEFELEEKGALLLDYFYKKVGFSIDLPINRQKFCELVEKEGKEGKIIKLLNTSGPAVLAIGTGVGKTTKTINCLVRGEQRNVVLVCPTSALVNSAFGHHKNWLQDWECVYHPELDESGKQIWVDAKDKKTDKPILDEGGNKKQRRKYIHHGNYAFAKNDLVHEKDEDGEIEMKSGLSILEPGYLFGYLTRRLFVDAYDKAKKNSKIKEWFKGEEIDEMRKKLIDKRNTIIVFDEAHFGVAMYQELIRQTIRLGYKVICMSATFRAIDKTPVPFSITSTYGISSRLVSGFKSNDLDKNLKNEKTFVFLKNMKLSDKQKQILEDSNISYIIFDKAYEPAAEGISEGMPPGSLMIGDNTYEMGFTFDIDNAISTNWMEMANLEPGWVYSRPPHTQRLPLASMVQQRGRVGRKKDGKWYILSNKIEEITVTGDFAAKLVKAVLSEDVSVVKPKSEALTEQDYWVYLAGAISVEEKFGLSPEAIIIGLTGSPNKPRFHNDNKKKPSGCDEDLWYKHIHKKDKPIEMNPAELGQAKEILKIMVDTLLNQQKNFPYKIKIEIENQLIEKTGLEVKEVRHVLNNFIDKKLKELYNHEDYDKEKKSSKNEKLIKDITELHELALEENIIEITREPKDPSSPEKGEKENKTLWILYKAKKIEEIKTRSFRNIDMATEKEKLDEIKNYLGMLLDLWEGGNPSNKEIRKAFKINTIFGYKELVEDMREDDNIEEAERLAGLIKRLEENE